jgi:hypothetical protein
MIKGCYYVAGSAVTAQLLLAVSIPVGTTATYFSVTPISAKHSICKNRKDRKTLHAGDALSTSAAIKLKLTFVEMNPEVAATGSILLRDSAAGPVLSEYGLDIAKAEPITTVVEHVTSSSSTCALVCLQERPKYRDCDLLLVGSAAHAYHGTTLR